MVGNINRVCFFHTLYISIDKFHPFTVVRQQVAESKCAKLVSFHQVLMMTEAQLA